MRVTEKKKFFFKLLPFIFYLSLWEIVSLAVGEPMLFPSLKEVGGAFLKLWYNKSFYAFVLNTCAGVFGGFFTAFLGGSFLGFLSFKNETVKSFLKIPLMLMKSIPVAAYIIMLYMWLPSGRIPFFIAFIAVCPVVYNNIYDSFLKKNKDIDAMARVFEVKGLKKFIYISFPEAFPFIRASLRTGLALSFKAAVAAEVITAAADTIGGSFYDAKVYFDMTQLLSWTLALLLISFLFERLFLRLLNFALKKVEEGLAWI